MNDFNQMREQSVHASQFLKTLAHPTRLLTLCALINEELSVGQLLTITDVSQSVLSQHLAVLRNHNLVTTRREQQTIYYQLSNDHSIRIIEQLQQIFCP